MLQYAKAVQLWHIVYTALQQFLSHCRPRLNINICENIKHEWASTRESEHQRVNGLLLLLGWAWACRTGWGCWAVVNGVQAQLACVAAKSSPPCGWAHCKRQYVGSQGGTGRSHRPSTVAQYRACQIRSHQAQDRACQITPSTVQDLPVCNSSATEQSMKNSGSQVRDAKGLPTRTQA